MIGTICWRAPNSGAALPVTQVSAGDNFTLFVQSDGSLWAMGDNSHGQLGDVTYTTRYSPVQIAFSNVLTTAAGGSHSAFVESDGSLWTMGQGGALGDGKTEDRNFPQSIVSSGVSLIAAGGNHCLFKRTTGSRLTTISLLAFGYNGYGQLGDGTELNQPVPEQIQSSQFFLFAASTLTARGNHTLYIEAYGGELWAMGENTDGEFGDGTTTTRVTTPEQICSNVVAVATGEDHTVFIKSGGTLWAMGANSAGQLGDGTRGAKYTPVQIADSAVAVAAGNTFSLFIKSDGSLWGMGANSLGQLGDGTGMDHQSPVEIVSSNVVAVTAGSAHALFIKSDGTLWAMGNNNDGQLGDGTQTPRLLPYQVVPLIVNNAPVLPVIPDQMVDELEQLIVTNTAVDIDVPANNLTYTLIHPPDGVTIDTNGVITWIPSEFQGPSTNTITTVVTDLNASAINPHLSATNSFTVVVAEVNSPPRFFPISDQVTRVGQLLTIQASAYDYDYPKNMLTFGLAAAPTNMAINLTNGLITWVPSITQTGSQAVLVTAVDDGQPPLADTVSFTVQVNGQTPRMVAQPLPGGLLGLSIFGDIGVTYVLQTSTNLSLWVNLSTVIPTSSPYAFTPGPSSDAQRFYRLVLFQ